MSGDEMIGNETFAHYLLLCKLYVIKKQIQSQALRLLGWSPEADLEMYLFDNRVLRTTEV